MRSIWLGCIRSLLAGGNWNNASNAGVSYLNANNTASIVNPNIRSHLELRFLSDPEQRPTQNRIYPVKQKTNQPEELVLLGMPFRAGRAT